MESEALESIFVDEFEQVSASPFHWRIKLQPHPSGDDEENHGITKWITSATLNCSHFKLLGGNHKIVAITLEAKIPPAYPNEVPTLDVIVTKGLTEEQRTSLLELANEKVGR